MEQEEKTRQRLFDKRFNQYLNDLITPEEMFEEFVRDCFLIGIPVVPNKKKETRDAKK